MRSNDYQMALEHATKEYQIALEHATNEIVEINALLEELAHRKDVIEKLVELLKLLVPPSGPVDSTAAIVDAPAPEVPAPLAAAHIAPEPEAAYAVHEPTV